ERVALPTVAWQHVSYWPDMPMGGAAGTPTGHVLLGSKVSVAGSAGTWEALWSRRAVPWLCDHQVQGRVVVPGAALAEVLRAAGQDLLGAAAEVRGLVLQVPVLLPEAGAVRVQIVLDERGAARLFSQPMGGDPDEWTLHATAEVGASTERPAHVDVAKLRAEAGTALDVADTYAAYADNGLGYGPAFQGMTALFRGEDRAFAEVDLPLVAPTEGLGLSPALLDAALQAIAASSPPNEPAGLPFEIGKFAIFRSGARKALVHVTRTGPGAANVVLFEPGGAVIAELGDVRLRPLVAVGASQVAEALYRVDWTELAPAEAAAVEGRWLSVGVDTGVGEAVTDLAAALPADHVLLAASAIEPTAAMADANLLVATVQTLGTASVPARLWVVAEAGLCAAGLRGFVRAVQAEHPELRATLIEVPSLSETEAALATELGATDDEDIVRHTGGKRLAPRLVRAGALIPPTENWGLEKSPTGQLDAMMLLPRPRPEPAPGEVEI
ncbi:MAG: polyketide synthase dehydratase domain-containing protein, partial [Kofleriaceae bacterium]|nr:polyketide synthase dehydratase domain-containing protein [Kofleriaceae bacterium]